MSDLTAVKNYWDNRPCNIRHSTASIGTKEYFDQVEARKYFVEPHIPAFAEFDKWKGKKLGTDAINFARAGAHYTALELSVKSMELAQKRFEVFGLNGTFYQGSAEELDQVVPVETYDLVYSFGVIHHTPNPGKVMECVKKFLGPQSEFRLMLYARNSWKNAMIEAGFDQPEAQSGCPVAFTYTEAEVRELMPGYNVFEYQQDHIFPYVIEKYVKYDYEFQPWFKAMPPEMFRAIEKAFGWHGLIKARIES